MKKKKRVLIVDDSYIIRKLLEKKISSLDVDIVGMAEDGKSAIDLFNKVLPDIVTLDLSMPEVDGLVVLEEMLKMKNDVKVIVISAMTDKSTALKALKKGAKIFIAKPFTSEKIIETFNKIID